MDIFQRSFQQSDATSINYTVYHGQGPPPRGTGNPGDIYVNRSPEGYQLFVFYDTWVEWRGIYRSRQDWEKEHLSNKHTAHRSLPFAHPADPGRTIWCTRNGVKWYTKATFCSGRTGVFKALSKNKSFLSAHELITMKFPMLVEPLDRTSTIMKTGTDTETSDQQVSATSQYSHPPKCITVPDDMHRPLTKY
jgi:hypothetical protein